MTSPSRNLQAAWLQGARTPEEKKAREDLIRNSVMFSQLLLTILSSKYETIERKGFNEDDYADTSWVTLQAFRNGKLAMLTEIAELFQHLKDKD